MWVDGNWVQLSVLDSYILETILMQDMMARIMSFAYQDLVVEFRSGNVNDHSQVDDEGVGVAGQASSIQSKRQWVCFNIAKIKKLKLSLRGKIR